MTALLPPPGWPARSCPFACSELPGRVRAAVGRQPRRLSAGLPRGHAARTRLPPSALQPGRAGLREGQRGPAGPLRAPALGPPLRRGQHAHPVQHAARRPEAGPAAAAVRRAAQGGPALPKGAGQLRGPFPLRRLQHGARLAALRLCAARPGAQQLQPGPAAAAPAQAPHGRRAPRAAGALARPPGPQLPAVPGAR